MRDKRKERERKKEKRQNKQGQREDEVAKMQAQRKLTDEWKQEQLIYSLAFSLSWHQLLRCRCSDVCNDADACVVIIITFLAMLDDTG